MDKKQRFIEKVENLYGEKAPDILQHLSTKTKRSFWVNTFISQVDTTIESLTSQGFEIKKSVIPNMFIVENESESLSLTKTEEYIENKIYIQNLSSAIPVMVLDPKDGELILDLTAAPGSKTSLMQIYSGGKSNVIATEKNKGRFFTLKKNLENYAIPNVQVFNIDATRIAKIKPDLAETFDKVLVDAPCSNEAGICFSDSEPFKFWNPKKGKSLSNLQKSLIASGFDMLKSGGELVYSTCTFSFEENESVVNWLLEKYDNAKLVQITLPSEVPFMKGLTDFKRISNDELRITNRILPDGEFEGFFVAKISKF